MWYPATHSGDDTISCCTLLLIHKQIIIIGEKLAFGSLWLLMIRDAYLGPTQPHTSLHHTMRLLGNSSLWLPGIGGGLWINGENTPAGTQCSGQACSPPLQSNQNRKESKIWKICGNNFPGPTQLLEGRQNQPGFREIRISQQRHWRDECEDLQVFVCVGGRQLCALQAPSADTPCSLLYCCSRALTFCSWFTKFFPKNLSKH